MPDVGRFAPNSDELRSQDLSSHSHQAAEIAKKYQLLKLSSLIQPAMLQSFALFAALRDAALFSRPFAKQRAALPLTQGAENAKEDQWARVSLRHEPGCLVSLAKLHELMCTAISSPTLRETGVAVYFYNSRANLMRIVVASFMSALRMMNRPI